MAKSALDSMVAKFAHDMASPLGGVMMAIDLLDDEDSREQSIKIIQEAAQKMRVLLTLWRMVFSLGDDPLEEEPTFLSSFQDYLKAYQGDIKILMARSSAPSWQVRLGGTLLLGLSDRIGLIRSGVLSFDHNTLSFQGAYDKGDLFDRIRIGADSFSHLPITRQALPLYLQEFSDNHKIKINWGSSSPFRVQFQLGGREDGRIIP